MFDHGMKDGMYLTSICEDLFTAANRSFPNRIPPNGTARHGNKFIANMSNTNSTLHFTGACELYE